MRTRMATLRRPRIATPASTLISSPLMNVLRARRGLNVVHRTDAGSGDGVEHSDHFAHGASEARQFADDRTVARLQHGDEPGIDKRVLRCAGPAE